MTCPGYRTDNSMDDAMMYPLPFESSMAYTFISRSALRLMRQSLTDAAFAVKLRATFAQWEIPNLSIDVFMMFEFEGRTNPARIH